MGVFDNTAPWWDLTDNSECKPKQEPKNVHPVQVYAFIYLFTEGYFQYTVVQIYFVEFPYSEEKGTFRLMKGKKLEIAAILSFSSSWFRNSFIHE